MDRYKRPIDLLSLGLKPDYMFQKSERSKKACLYNMDRFDQNVETAVAYREVFNLDKYRHFIYLVKACSFDS